MPGKSKRGGGLESSPVYKKQEFGTPFKMKSSPAKYYEELEMFKKQMRAKAMKAGKGMSKAKNIAKIGVRGLLSGTAAMGTAAYGLFKGYGNLAKQKHGKQIIKDSGVGRTRKA